MFGEFIIDFYITSFDWVISLLLCMSVGLSSSSRPLLLYAFSIGVTGVVLTVMRANDSSIGLMIIIRFVTTCFLPRASATGSLPAVGAGDQAALACLYCLTPCPPCADVSLASGGVVAAAAVA